MSKSGTELTTPSLCSDTEQGDEPSLEDRVPTTPPLSTTRSRSRSISTDAPRLREGKNGRMRAGMLDALDNENIQQARGEPRIKLPARPEPGSRSQDMSSLLRVPDDMFASRPPSSPLPFDSPKRPRPPPRVKARSIQSTAESLADDEDDPLVLSAPVSVRNHLLHDVDPFTSGPPAKPDLLPQEPRIPRVISSTRPPAPSNERRLPMRPPFRPSLEVDISQQQNTLEAELLRADSSYSSYDQEFLDDVYDDAAELENGTLTTVGSRLRKDGFIAHGGAGGIPIVMGPGNVDGLEDDEDQCLPKRPSRGKRKTSMVGTGRKKGRSRA